MDLKEIILEKIDDNSIIELMEFLGSDSYKNDNKGYLFKTICHKGNAHKLHYFSDSKTFFCYTECNEKFDIFTLIMKVFDFNFSESIDFLKRYFNINIYEGFHTSFEKLDDWNFINKYKNNLSIEEEPNTVYNNNVLKIFYKNRIIEWEQDCISYKAIKKYNISLDIARNSIIIPYYNISGELIGIRERRLNPEDVEYAKYKPKRVNGFLYNFKKNKELYGLYQNKERINNLHKVILFESEKSVLQCESYYSENNYSVALCGMNITFNQIKLLLELDVREVIIALDKQYDSILELEEFKEKVLNKLYGKLNLFFDVKIIMDNENILNYKDSPSDRGKEILEYLLSKKFKL